MQSFEGQGGKFKPYMPLQYAIHESEDSSLQPQFSLTILLCLRSDTRHNGHFNRCSYLLTYFQGFSRP